MKIRPKTFECACKLVDNGYILVKGGRDCYVRSYYPTFIIWRGGIGGGWVWGESREASSTKAWQDDKDWYFKK